MRLEKASYEIWDEKIPLYDHIERCGRICYASEPLGGEKAVEFCNRLIKSGHLSVLEHGTIYLKMDSDSPDSAKYYDDQYSEHYVDEEDNVYITANYRRIVENNWLKDLKYLCEPTPYHDKRITVKWNVNRAIANEIVRHRKFGFSQQSTRYCNYSKSKFNNECTFIIPSWCTYPEGCYLPTNSLQYGSHIWSLRQSEEAYFELLHDGWTAQQARDVLPLALKTELVMTGFAHNWAAFFKLRCDNHAHPDVRQLAIKLRDEFYKKGYIV